MVLEEDLTTGHDVYGGTLRKRELVQSITKKKSKKVKQIRIGVGILLVAFMAVVVTVAFIKWTPYKKTRAGLTNEEKTNTDGIIFRAIFSTNHIWGNTSGTPTVINAAAISKDLNKRLVGSTVSVMNMLLIPNLASYRQLRKLCENGLSGYYLQMVVFASSSQCANQNQMECKLQIEKDLHDLFRDFSTTTISVQLEENSNNILTIKLCSLTYVDDQREQIRLKSGATNIRAKAGRTNALNNAATCALCINRLGSTLMNGEYGTRIDDDFKININYGDDRYQTHRSATVLEGSQYQLSVNLDCGSQWSNPCSSSLSVTAWIDYNDNDFDDGESFVMVGSWSSQDTPTGQYISDIQVPLIDGRRVKSGPHTLRVTVAASAEYQRRCGNVGYQETRDYTINVVPRVIATTLPPKPICALPFPRIILVIMAGEKGTEIRDDLPRRSEMSPYENEHHQDVTLFENTIYMIRIQLDCATQLSTELTPNGCNLAQDVFVAIDRNHDGRYDESEMGTPYRWPVTSYMAEGIYDIQLHVPAIQDTYTRQESHRMRILVLPSNYYVRNCGYNRYNETREYEVTIIPAARRTALSNVGKPVYIPRDYQCSSDVSKILLVVMASEYRTQIRDDPSTDLATRNDPVHERHSVITLYEDNVYLLRIQLECHSNRGKETARVNCSLPHDVNAWIDLNDDGVFDESENAAPYRWPLTSYVPEGVYDLQIYVPSLNERAIRTGPHTLRLEVTLNEDYRRRCGNNYYRETRDYNVTIVKYKTESANIGIPLMRLSDNVCSQVNSKVVLVIMAGELGTHIRDDTPLNTIIRDNQDRHHMGITLYENTIYRIRIQLDCDQSSSRSTYHQNCNLAQDVNVFIDFNNDGVFDESETRVNDRWPLYTSVGLGIYDLDLPIPNLGERGLRGGSHRMRVVVKSSDEYVYKCRSSGYQETREYSVNVIPRSYDSWGK